MMKQHGRISDRGAVPRRSTINTFTECAYDGPELGSTSVGSEVELTG